MITVETIHDDGVARVERVLLNGKDIGTNTVDIVARAEVAAVDARREVLRAVVDPKRATPAAEDVLQAQAFLALAALDGVKEALAVADESVAADPVDPKGGVRNV